MIVPDAVELYLERKQAYGFLFTHGCKVLRAFSKRVGSLQLERVTARDVLSFLDGPKTSAPTWRSKYGLLKHFFEFWSLRGAMLLLHLPPPQPATRRTFTPYIYTRPELRCLLRATRLCQKRNRCTIDPATLRCLILTL